MRDSAQYSRSDTFNLEAVELINGANSAMSGAGSVGGNINLVTKTAGQGDFTNVVVGGGSDRYGRLTADSNYDFENGTAVRLNAMGHTQDVPGRDEEFRHRWGFAPSVAFGLGSDTRFTLSYLHQHDNNLPQYGVPFALSPFNNGPLPGVDRETYYGYRNVARQEIDVDMLTGVLEMDFDDNVKLRSLARVQRVDQTTTATAPEGTWCLPNNTNAYTGRACVGQPPATWNPNSGPRGLVRETENFIAHSQTDLTATLHTGAIEHRLVAGIAFSKEDFELNSGSIFRNADGSTTGITYPLQSFDNPYNIWTGPQNYFRTGRSKGSLTNQAVYLFDTLQFNEQWMLNLGGRYERQRRRQHHLHRQRRRQCHWCDPGLPGRQRGGPVLVSRRSGVQAGRERQPVSVLRQQQDAVQGLGQRLVHADRYRHGGRQLQCRAGKRGQHRTGRQVGRVERASGADRCGVPQRARKLQGQQRRPADSRAGADGKARVDGIALGAAGYLTERWSIFANYTFLDSEVLQSVSNRTESLTGDPIAGRELVQTPRNAGNIWTTYQLNQWTFGYGVTYQGGFYPNNSSVAGYVKTDDYWVHRAMVGLRVNDWLSLQLNVNNLFDEEYYTSIRNNLTVNAAGTVTAGNGWALPGDGRSAVLSATFSF